jgi:uncharacterized membrane protein YebE (DUF533 family)
MDGIAGIVTAVCGGLAALLVAAIPLVQLKYRKPLQQAQVAIDGVAAATNEIAVHVKEYNGLVAQAKKNDGKVDAIEMAAIMTKMGTRFTEIAALVGTEIDAVKTAGK